MRLLTWNINGIRASKIPLPELFDSLQSDIICLQETKITRDRLDELTADVEGYNAYFSFSRKKTGYSGVATYCRNSCTPVKAEEGLSGVYSKKDVEDLVGAYGNLSDFSDDELVSLDCEGRAVVTQHEIRLQDATFRHVAIINVYCPRYDAENEHRHQYKLRFFALLQVRAEALKKQGSHVIILGDLNTTHRFLDHCEPNSQGGSNSTPSRIWLNQMMWPHQRDSDLDKKQSELTELCVLPSHVTGGMFVDTFRYFHPEMTGAYTNWCTLTGARQTNYGRRLDYILCDSDLAQISLTDCTIMNMVAGSDHCPVKATFDCVVVTAFSCPSLCAKLMPEFTGRQQKLSAFFVKSSEPAERILAKKSTNSESLSAELTSDPVDLRDEADSQNNKDTVSQSGSFLKGSRSSSVPSSKRSSSDMGNQSKRKKSKVPEGNKTAKQTSLIGFLKRNNPATKTTVTDADTLPTVNATQPFSSSANKDSTELFEMSSDGEISSSQESQTDSGNTRSSENSQLESQDSKKINVPQVSAWKLLMKGPPSAPLCSKHKEPCVLRTVKKAGLNRGKQFFTCARPEGAAGNPDARCNYFVWVKDLKK